MFEKYSNIKFHKHRPLEAKFFMRADGQIDITNLTL
jgi:hypothetical protein